MEFLFYLDDIEIEQPIGFADIELSIVRDEEYHGIGFEATTGTIEFYGTGADYLRTKKETEGMNANVVFRAEVLCNAYQEEENIYTGRVNFGTYQEKCGDSCTVLVGLEEDSCIVTLRNRIDQNVDIDSLVAFDKMTALPDYVMMGEEITLPAIRLDARVEGYIPIGGDETVYTVNDDPDTTAFGINIRPSYDREVFDSINDGGLIPASEFSQIGPLELPVSPQLLFNDNLDCFPGVFTYEFRFKGRFSINANITGFLATAYIYTWTGQNDFSDDAVIIESEAVPGSATYVSGTIVEFDITFSSTIALEVGMGLYGLIQFSGFNSSPQTFDIGIEWDEETYVDIFQSKICPSTTSEYYMIHETLSRSVESITNGCARVKSEYYGRTDSEPFTFAEDGCGSLHMLTSGLKIRKAEKDYFFTSFKKLIDGVNAIDNIGFGLEDDPLLPNKKVVRIEDLDFFYQSSNVILTLPAIPSALSEVREDMYVSTIKIGYKKWEVERVNGLDEVNSTREYRTNFETVNKVLDLESELVAGSYAIELTRQQSFASTGAADTSYDNDTFIICLLREGYNTFAVDTAQVSGTPLNIYSPETKYNLQITPARNMARWLKSTLNGYTNIADTASKIFFSSGTGNIDAVVIYNENINNDECYFLADKEVSEKQDQAYNFPQTPVVPIWKNETITIDEYPLSVSDYRLIKTNPYGVVRYQCGTGAFQDGYIKEIKYQPVSGRASFVLIKKYGV